METPPAAPNPPVPKPTMLRPRLSSTGLWLVLCLVGLVAFLYLNNESPQRDKISYDFFRQELDKGNIKEVTFTDNREIVGKFKVPPVITTTQADVAKGEEKPVKRELKPEFSAVLSPYVGEELDREMRDKAVHI